MTIGERIKNLRKDSLKLTMEDFGSRLGVGKTAISRIESGDRAVTEQMQIAICREFHVRPEWLRDGEEPIFVEKTENEIVRSYVDEILSEDERADPLAVKFIETLARMDRDSLNVVYDFCMKWVKSVEEKEAAAEEARIAKEKNDRPLGTPEGIAEAEAAYEKRFGIPSKAESNTSDIGGAGRKDA